LFNGINTIIPYFFDFSTGIVKKVCRFYFFSFFFFTEKAEKFFNHLDST